MYTEEYSAIQKIISKLTEHLISNPVKEEATSLRNVDFPCFKLRLSKTEESKQDSNELSRLISATVTRNIGDLHTNAKILIAENNAGFHRFVQEYVKSVL